MKYRAEIDGLRALAVIPVIFFHAGFQAFSGGFVGVDVFFVISGFLITTIILAEKEAGTFSTINFYERRARRILPALFLVMFVCLPFAWFWLLPDDMKSFSEGLVAVSTFASNIFFYKTSGYFDTATELKPLIHTWSLAVEEQYYVLFPLFLILTWRLGKRWIIGLLSLVFVISLVGAQSLSQTYPSFAFYMLPTRGWELLIGTFVAFYYAHNNIKKHNHNIGELCSLVGLLLVAYSVFSYDDQTPFPSIYALAPTLGAALIIIFATHKTVVGKLLGSKLFVGMGLVSYSAYLWHQPMFAFARQQHNLTEPSMYLMTALAVLSFALAYFSWKFVERPFRNKHRISRNKVFAYGALCSLVFISVGLAGYLSKGFEKYWLEHKPTNIANALTLMNDANKTSAVFIIENRHDNGDCIFNVENLTEKISDRLLKCYIKYGDGVAVLGDSHATNLFDSLFFENNSRLNFIVGFTKNGCHLPTKKYGCQYDEFLMFVENNPKTFSTIVYEKAGFLMLRTADRSITPNISKLALADNVTGIYTDNDVLFGVLEYLKKLSVSASVIWLGPRIEPQINKKIITSLGCDYPFKLRNNQYEIYSDLDKSISTIAKNVQGIEYVSQIKLYEFNFPQDFMNCDVTYWIDGNHFSESGEKHFGSRFDFIDFILKKKSHN